MSEAKSRHRAYTAISRE